jgi:hypothetical protein
LARCYWIALAPCKQAAFAADCAAAGKAPARSLQNDPYAALNFALSPEAAASATFWQSAESALRLLGSSAALLLTALSHPCLAAAATAEFVPPPELLDVLEPPDVLDPPELPDPPELLDDVPDPPDAELELLLLPQPATSAPPSAATVTMRHSFLTM